jgi:hypothetical protein
MLYQKTAFNMHLIRLGGLYFWSIAAIAIQNTHPDLSITAIKGTKH